MCDTREAISNAFLALAEKKNPDNITVTDICNQANIVRKTFYYYFEDKFDLFKYTYKNNLVKRIRNNFSGASWSEVIEKSINEAIESRDFFDKVLGKSSLEFSQIIFDIQYEIYYQELAKNLPEKKLPLQTEAEMYMFLKGGTEYLKYYFQTYKDKTYTNIAKLIVGAMPKSLDELWQSNHPQTDS